MLRLSYVCSIVLHLLLLGVIGAVVPHDSDQLPEVQNIQVSVQTHSVTVPSSPPISTAQSHLSLPPLASPSFTPPEQAAPQKRQTMIPPSTAVLASAPVIKKSAKATSVHTKTPPMPQDAVMMTKTFPTPTPPPTPVPTAPPTLLPTPVPTPTLLPTPTVTPKATIIPDLPTPNITATPQPASSPWRVDTTIARRDEPAESESTNRGAEQVVQTASEHEGQKAPVMSGTPVRDLSEERRQILLKAYLQEVAARIHAVKTYPRNARRKGWEGTVVVKLQLAFTGEVQETDVAQTSGYELLDEAALEAVRNAHPFPQFPEGVMTSSLVVNIPIQFTLK